MHDHTDAISRLDQRLAALEGSLDRNKELTEHLMDALKSIALQRGEQFCAGPESPSGHVFVRVTGPLSTAFYACARCAKSVQIDYPDNSKTPPPKELP